MKIILAFDSFKNCLSAVDVCAILRKSMLEAAPELEIISMPLGDGGEGTAQAVTSASNGIMQSCKVHDPLFREVQASFGLLPNNSAVLEMASASGIELIKRSERDPMRTTTYGTGELLEYLICRKNIRNFTIGIGGSATVDGGIGMLQALGVKFFDENDRLLPCPATGNDIARLKRIDKSSLLPEIADCHICIASDVTNPLCGNDGAARVFAPQKGADAQTVEVLENNLKNFAEISITANYADNCTTPGDGAAGGLGFALRNYLKAESVSGAELVLKVLDFDKAAADADLVITGEGCSDHQTAHGKLPSIVAAHAHKFNVPVILLSGALGEKSAILADTFEAVLALAHAPCSLEEALAAAEENLQRMGKNIVNLLKISR